MWSIEHTKWIFGILANRLRMCWSLVLRSIGPSMLWMIRKKCVSGDDRNVAAITSTNSWLLRAVVFTLIISLKIVVRMSLTVSVGKKPFTIISGILASFSWQNRLINSCLEPKPYRMTLKPLLSISIHLSNNNSWSWLSSRILIACSSDNWIDLSRVKSSSHCKREFFKLPRVRLDVLTWKQNDMSWMCLYSLVWWVIIDHDCRYLAALSTEIVVAQRHTFLRTITTSLKPCRTSADHRRCWLLSLLHSL